MKKLLAFLLAAGMTLGLLTGCGGNGTESSSPETSKPASTAESQEPSQEAQEKVSLRLVLYGDMTPRREEFFKNEFHDAILNDLNIDLTMEILPWGSGDVVKNMLASGEAFALNHWLGADNLESKNYLAEIPEDLIQKYMPEYLEMRGKNGFECAKFNGKIMLIPFGCKAYGGQYQFYTVRKDILDKVGYKAEDITTTDKLLEVFEAVHQAYPDMRVAMNENVSFKTVGYALTGILATTVDSAGFIYVNEKEEGDRVYSFYESDIFKSSCEWNRNLLEKGYIIGDSLTDPGKYTADWTAGNGFAKGGAPAEIVETGFISKIPGAEITRIRIADAPYVIKDNYDWGIAISASDAEHIDRWLQLFNWMYKDQETYDFCVYGVEGKDYEWDADGRINRLVTDVFMEDWFMMADCYQVFPKEISEENIKMYEESDASAILSKAAGFLFDSSAVSTEISLVQAAWSEYMVPVRNGYVDYEENYPNAIQKMKEAGLDTVVAEYQKQFSEWYANK